MHLSCCFHFLCLISFVFQTDFLSYTQRVLKDNRLVALSREDKNKGRFVRSSQLELTDQQVVRGWLKGFSHEVLVVRRLFTNKDGYSGLLTLLCSDLAGNGEQVHQKRSTVGAFHKFLKSNAGLANSPTRTVTTP
jgi:hypothetical protein